MIESLFYGGENVVPFEAVEYLIGRRSFVQILLPEIRIHYIRYVIDVDDASSNLSQFVHNFVEIHNCIYCFKISIYVVYIL